MTDDEIEAANEETEGLRQEIEELELKLKLAEQYAALGWILLPGGKNAMYVDNTCVVQTSTSVVSSVSSTPSEAAIALYTATCERWKDDPDMEVYWQDMDTPAVRPKDKG